MSKVEEIRVKRTVTYDAIITPEDDEELFEKLLKLAEKHGTDSHDLDVELAVCHELGQYLEDHLDDDEYEMELIVEEE